MKVITRAVFQMTDTPGEYVPIEEASFEYEGPTAQAGGGGKGGKGDVDMPNFNKITKIMTKNAELAKELGLEELDWAKSQWDSQEALLNDVLSTQKGITQSRLGDVDTWKQQYQEGFQPLEQQLIEDANTYASDWKREAEAGKAAADVGQAFAAERRNARKRLEDYGIDPSQTRSQALDYQVSANEAIAKAGAMNQARERVDATGRELRGQAINLGQQNLNRAMTGENTAYDMSGGTLNTQTAGLQGGQNLRQQAILPYLNQAGQSLSGIGGLMGQQSQAAKDDGGMGQLIGTGAGIAASAMGWAEGGPVDKSALPMEGEYQAAGEYDAKMGYKDIGTQDGQVSGPGGPKDDLIDARLSDGEYVIPAEVVARKGTEFFDRLVEKTKEGIPQPQQVGDFNVTPAPGALPPPQAEMPTPMPMRGGGYVTPGAIPLAGGGLIRRR